MVEAKIDPTFESWRDAARLMLNAEIDPADVWWTDGSEAALPMLAVPLETEAPARGNAPPASFTVSKEFIALARTVSFHRDRQRWSLLYRVLFRLTHVQPRLLEIAVDDDVHRLRDMEKSVRRDLHKMHAFVRFRRVERDDGEHYIAFHRPDHLIMPAAAPWFARRFPVMRWTILTPDASASWDGERLQFGPGVPGSSVDADAVEDLWRTYYANIFNPARIKIKAMKKELPVRHWRTLPETQIIDDLLRNAPARVEQMIRHTRAGSDVPHAAKSAAPFVPSIRQLPVLREAARVCKGCDLYCDATQTVFGEGPATAIAMFVGEQPGDEEDIAGRPFVGPAGRLLNEALAQAGIDRTRCYVTNAVKHFKFEPRGKRRIHAKPNAREISACKPWLLAEVETIRPGMIIALGATAAQAIMGPEFKVTQSHGKVFTDCGLAPWFMATIHPSALLRIPDPALRVRSHRQFLEDLEIARKEIAARSSR